MYEGTRLCSTKYKEFSKSLILSIILIFDVDDQSAW